MPVNERGEIVRGATQPPPPPSSPIIPTPIFQNPPRNTGNVPAVNRPSGSSTASGAAIAVILFFIVIAGFGLLINSLSTHSVQTSSSNSQVPPNVDIASERKLVEADLTGKSAQELTFMRNEPYARHGYQFGRGQGNSPIYDYFSSQPWYKPNNKDIELCWQKMSSVERYNAKFILQYEKRHGMQTPGSGR